MRRAKPVTVIREWFGKFSALSPAARIALLSGFVLLVVFIPVLGDIGRGIGDISYRLEESLLDFRLRFRAEELQPSADIIFVAFDQDAVQFGREHPELGLQDFLPRDQLARVIDYLKKGGAKAILLDTYFEIPRQKAGDDALAKAIRDAGNVYVNTAAERTMEESEQQIRFKKGNDLFPLIMAQIYMPYLRSSAASYHYMPDQCGMGFFRLGFKKTLVNWPLHWEQVCTREASRESQASSLYPAGSTVPGQSVPMLSAGRTAVDAYLAGICMRTDYENAFARQKDFLAALDERQLPLTFAERPAYGVEKQFSVCGIKYVVSDFLKAAKGFGFTTVYYDQDAFLRDAPVFFRSYQGHFYPTFSLSLALDELGRPPLTYEGDDLKIGDKTVQLYDGRKVIVNWRNPKLLVEEIYRQAHRPESEIDLDRVNSENRNEALGYGHMYRMVSVSDILRKIYQLKDPATGKVVTDSLYNIFRDPGSGELSFRNKYVIYGSALREEFHRTPAGNQTLGPEYNATLLDMFLHDDKFVTRAPVWLDICLIMLLCGLTAYVVGRLPNLYSGVLAGFLVIVAYWVNNFFIFRTLALWLPLIWPTILLLLALAASMIYRYYVQDREKRDLTGVFSKFVSPQVMNEILVEPAKAMENLKGTRKELTVLFADIHNFTNQFEAEEPERIVQQLNEYFNVMTHIVLKYGGTNDKYMGDALMAFFGAPTAMPNHAEMACRAALEMQQALEPLNRKWAEEGRTRIRHGIGISTGPMFVGHFGADELKNFTVMGSNVNLGARLETHTRQVGHAILISELTYEKIQTLAEVEDLGQVPIKGFSKPIRIYALCGIKTADSPSNPLSSAPEAPAAQPDPGHP